MGDPNLNSIKTLCVLMETTYLRPAKKQVIFMGDPPTPKNHRVIFRGPRDNHPMGHHRFSTGFSSFKCYFPGVMI